MSERSKRQDDSDIGSAYVENFPTNEHAEHSNIPPSIINTHLNDLFAQRLGYLEVNAPKDNQLKLLVYQEWIDTLHRSTQAAINYKETIEKEILQRLNPFQCRLLIDAEEFEIQYQKCRRDIKKLIEFIQRAFHHNDWDMTTVKLETTQILRKLS